MELGTIIRKKRKEQGLTLDQLSTMAGCSKPYLSTIETGKVSPPAPTLLSKLEKLLGFEPDTLVNLASIEKLPPKVREDFESYKQENTKLKHIIRTLSEKVTGGEGAIQDGYEQVDEGFVPIINRVLAGYPNDFDDLGYPAGFADDYIKCPDLADANAFAVRIIGDSMLPDYKEGDIVVFSPSRAVDSGDDCLIRFEDPHETTFKQVFFQQDKTLLLQPRNRQYPPIVANTERINGIYKAVRRYQVV